MLKLYTDESPGLRVDPFVVLVLSVGFIISVVMLHSESIARGGRGDVADRGSLCKDHQAVHFVSDAGESMREHAMTKATATATATTTTRWLLVLFPLPLPLRQRDKALLLSVAAHYVFGQSSLHLRLTCPLAFSVALTLPFPSTSMLLTTIVRLPRSS